ncbi:hypothetical protein V3O24_18190 [Methylobacter sp. Wu8]|uniref:lipopolysaccharide biosynthesis protein n=1 Tax=Methylobacter sp. Wu8 TaxID=3118457 RepID=UPI002F31573E
MIAIIFGRAAQFLLALVMMRVATTLLSPEEMGKVSLVITTIAFFALFLVNPVGMFINRRLHAWQESGVAWHYLIRYVNYLIFVALIAGMVLLLLYINEWVSFGISIGWLLLFVCGSLFFNTINQTAIPSLNLLGDSRKFVALTVATIAASFACATLLVQMVQASAQYWLLGLLLGQTLLGVIGTRVLFVRLQKTKALHVPLTIRWRNLHGLFSFAYPVALAVGLGWIQSQGYRYLMEERLGLTELGIFVAGYGISAGLIAGFESIFATYFQPKFYKRISNDNLSEQSNAWREYAQAILPSMLITSFFIMATAPDLTKLLLGPSFRQSAQFVVWGSLAESARISTAVFGMVAHARMNTKLLLLPNLVGAAMSISLIWYLTSIYGSDGVGLGLVFSSIVTLLLTIGITKNHLAVALPLRLFVQSAIMGVVLLVTAKILSQLLDYDGSHLFSFIRLCVIGLLFLLFQYSMLLPVLRREAVISHT